MDLPTISAERLDRMQAAVDKCRAAEERSFDLDDIDELIAAARAQGPREWLPIETAPKDGTPILGFMPTWYRDKGGISVVCWLDGNWLDHCASPVKPTHWQPLPTPPKQEPSE